MDALAINLLLALLLPALLHPSSNAGAQAIEHPYYPTFNCNYGCQISRIPCSEFDCSQNDTRPSCPPKCDPLAFQNAPFAPYCPPACRRTGAKQPGCPAKCYLWVDACEFVCGLKEGPCPTLCLPAAACPICPVGNNMGADKYCNGVCLLSVDPRLPWNTWLGQQAGSGSNSWIYITVGVILALVLLTVISVLVIRASHQEPVIVYSRSDSPASRTQVPAPAAAAQQALESAMPLFSQQTSRPTKSPQSKNRRRGSKSSSPRYR